MSDSPIRRALVAVQREDGTVEFRAFRFDVDVDVTVTGVSVHPPRWWTRRRALIVRTHRKAIRR